jgi:predicted GH43/DUF377 family glycosyl hydrolase
MVQATRTTHHLRPDPGRLVLRPFIPGANNFGGDHSHLDQIIRRALELPDAENTAFLDDLRSRYLGTFPDIEATWQQHFELAQSRSPQLAGIGDLARQLLIGALLTQSYAYEAVSLTNPAIVPIGEPVAGEQRFVMSARAIGEGHISSITFMSGNVDIEGDVVFDQRHATVSNGERTAPHYSRDAFKAKLSELGFMTPTTERILGLVPDRFTAEELEMAHDLAMDSDHDQLAVQDAVKRTHWVADSNYELRFDESLPVSEHVISPAAPAESRGMEDARFVRFTDDEGATTYYATYTAYDGVHILPQLIETKDFNMFRMATMTGPAIHHKGMALFPRKIRGEYVALSRHDHERSFLLRSDDVRVWHNAEVVFGPQTEWDIIQTGNCGSPLETESGWLVITHGVGPMRRYVLGALLLDLDEPSKVIARLGSPFIEAAEDEALGYVPDVVYSCGSMLHAGNLITPFGYSDFGIKIAVTPIADLIQAMS